MRNIYENLGIYSQIIVSAIASTQTVRILGEIVSIFIPIESPTILRIVVNIVGIGVWLVAFYAYAMLIMKVAEFIFGNDNSVNNATDEAYHLIGAAEDNVEQGIAILEQLETRLRHPTTATDSEYTHQISTIDLVQRNLERALTDLVSAMESLRESGNVRNASTASLANLRHARQGQIQSMRDLIDVANKKSRDG